MNRYFEVWVETVRSTVWPVHQEVTAYAMALFGGYNMWLITAVCTVGVLVASFMLWHVGQSGYRFFAQYASPAFQERYQNVQRPFHRYGFWFALLMWLPSGFSIGLALGFFNISRQHTLLLATAGSAVFYSYQFLIKPVA